MDRNTPLLPPVIRAVFAIVAGGWLAFVVWLLHFHGDTLTATERKWIAWLAAGPAFYLLCALLGGWIFSDARSRKLSDREFSWKRIAYGILVAGPTMAASIWIWRLMEGD